MIPVDHHAMTQNYQLQLANGVTFSIPIAEQYRGDVENGELANRGFQYHEPAPGSDGTAADRAAHRLAYQELLNPGSEA